MVGQWLASLARQGRYLWDLYWKKRKQFFFEKKNQKTFGPLVN